MSDERKELLDWIDRTLKGWEDMADSSHTKALASPNLNKSIKKDINYLKQIRRAIQTYKRLLNVIKEDKEVIEGMKQLLQRLKQKPEIDEKWIWKKARELTNVTFKPYPVEKAKNYLTQIVSDVRGGKVEVDKDFIRRWVDNLFSRYRISIGVKDYVENLLREAGVKIK